MDTAGATETIKKTRGGAELLLALLVLALAFGAVLPLKRAIEARIYELRESALTYLDGLLGLRVEYRRISPSFLASVEAAGLSFADDRGRVLVEADRASVAYDFFSIFGPSPRISAISIDGLRVDLDLVEDAGTIERIRRLAEGPPGGSKASLPELRISVDGLDFSLRTGSADIGGMDCSLGIILGKEGVEFDFQGDAAAKVEGGTFAAGGLHVKTFLPPDFSRARAEASLASFASPWVSLSSQRLALSWDGAALEARRLQDGIPLDLFARYDSATGTATAKAEFEDLRLGGIASLPRGAAVPAELLDASVTGKLSCAYDVAGGKGLSYDADVRAALGAVMGRKGYRVELSARGDSRGALLRNLVVEGEGDRLSFSGSVAFNDLMPEGNFAFDLARGGISPVPLSGAFKTEKRQGSLYAFAESIKAGDLGFEFVDAWLEPEPAGYGFRASMGYVGGGAAGGVGGSISLSGSLSLRPSPYLDCAIEIGRVSGAELYEAGAALAPGLPAAPAYLRDFSVVSDLYLNSDFKGLSFSAPRVVVSYDPEEGSYGVLSLGGNLERVAVNSFTFYRRGEKLAGTAAVELGKGGDLSFSAFPEYRGVKYEVSGLLEGGDQLLFSGSYGLSGSVLFGKGGKIDFSLAAAGFPIPLPGGGPVATVSLRGYWASEADFSVDLGNLAVKDLPLLPGYRCSVDMKGSLSQAGAALSKFALQDNFSTLAGTCSLSWGPSFAAPYRASLSLEDGSRTETYSATVLYKGAAENRVDLVFSGSPIGRFLGPDARGKASGILAATGNLEAPRVEFDASLSDAQAGKHLFGGRVKGLYLAGGFSLSDFDLRYMNHRFTGKKLDYDPATSRFEAALDARIMLGSEPLTFNCAASGNLGPGGLAAGAALLGEARARVDLRGISLGANEIGGIVLDASRKDGETRVDSVSDASLAFRMGPDGAFSLLLDSPLPAQGELRGRLVDWKIDASMQVDRLDFPRVWAFANQREVAFLGGEVSGSLMIKGDFLDPEMTGSAIARKVSVKVASYVPSATDEAEVRLVFDGRNLLLPKTELRAGGSPFTVEASMPISQWLPSGIDLKLKFSPLQPMPVAMVITGIDLRGFAYGDLSIASGRDGTLLAGRLAIDNSSIALSNSDSGGGGGGGGDRFAVRIDVVTGRKVEFLWPSRDLPLVRGYADTNDLVRISYDGSSGDFSIKGAVDIKSGNVFYFKRSFMLREGRISFNEGRLRFDPRLSVKAETRERAKGKLVTLYLTAEDNPLSMFAPKFSSDPPLSEVEIFAMLGENIFGTAGATGAGFQESVANASELITQFYLLSYFENSVRETLGLDMFSIQTQFLQNFTLGLFEAPGAAGTGLGGLLDNTSVTLGKYLGTDMFFQMMVGLEKGEGEASPLAATFEVGLDWKTPFFNLSWRFVPTDVSALLLDDNIFTFSWSFSF